LKIEFLAGDWRAIPMDVLTLSLALSIPGPLATQEVFSILSKQLY
jgi:hypothetical protein